MALALLPWGREGGDQRRPRLQIRPLPDLLCRLRRDDLPTERAIRFGRGGVVEVVHEDREGGTVIAELCMTERRSDREA